MHLYVSGCKSSYCRDKGAAQQHSAVTDVGTAWLSLRLDVLGFAVLTAAALLEVASDVTPALAGLSLIYALDVTKFLKFGTRIASKTETDFNSVERNAQYLQVSSKHRTIRTLVSSISVRVRHKSGGIMAELSCCTVFV